MECGELLLGREGKKFCSKKCSNKHHNRTRGMSNDLVFVNRILRGNHRIIFELSRGEQKLIAQETLSAKGFDFERFTGQINIPNIQGNIRLVYDCGYVILPGKIVHLFSSDALRSKNMVGKSLHRPHPLR
jgi:hypothetical protein